MSTYHLPHPLRTATEDLCHNNRWGEGGVMKVIKPPVVIMMSITVYQLSALIDITTYVTEAWSAQMIKVP